MATSTLDKDFCQSWIMHTCGTIQYFVQDIHGREYMFGSAEDANTLWPGAFDEENQS